MSSESNEGTPLYPNQPLVEVATEIRFKGNLAVEARRHEFQASIRDEYPLLLLPGAQDGIAPPMQHYRFEKEDRSGGVQLAINSCSFYSKQYPGAPKFIKDAERIFRLATDLIQPMEVSRMGWRYINAIPFIRENKCLPLTRIFDQKSVFGTGIHDRYEKVALEASTSVEEANLRVKLASGLSNESTEEEALLLDIDVFLDEEELNTESLRTIPDSMKRLHDLARSVFEDLITEQYRAFLKGGDDAE